MSCGISSPFDELSPIRGQIAHVLRTRAPCAHPLYCYRELRTRLACVKHAASVRSEPGSNSHVKLAAWKTKKPDSHFWMSDLKFSKRTFYRSIHSILWHLNAKVNRTGSGTSHLTQFVKEQWPPVQQAGYRTTQQL